MITIYSLSTEDHGIFYVGKTKFELWKRLYSHNSSCKLGVDKNMKKMEFFKYCVDNNIKIHIEPLDQTEDEGLCYQLESYWISQISSWGFTLCNIKQNGKTAYNQISRTYIPIDRTSRIPAHRKRKLKKVRLTKSELKIISKIKCFGDPVKISRMIKTHSSETIRLCLNGRLMKVRIYNAIKKYYKL